MFNAILLPRDKLFTLTISDVKHLYFLLVEGNKIRPLFFIIYLFSILSSTEVFVGGGQQNLPAFSSLCIYFQYYLQQNVFTCIIQLSCFQSNQLKIQNIPLSQSRILINSNRLFLVPFTCKSLDSQEKFNHIFHMIGFLQNKMKFLPYFAPKKWGEAYRTWCEILPGNDQEERGPELAEKLA